MGEGNSVRRVHVERLGLGTRGRTGCGVANMADADVALKAEHVALEEHVRDESV